MFLNSKPITERAVGRIIAVDTRPPSPRPWREVPQAPDVIEGSQIVHNTFVIISTARYSQLRLFALDGKPAGTWPLPTLGSIVQVTGEPHDTEMFYAFTSFLVPRRSSAMTSRPACLRPQGARDRGSIPRNTKRCKCFITARRDAVPLF